MAVIKQGGTKPYAGKVMTTMGIRDPRPPVCQSCGERREFQIYTMNPNGQMVCADCAGRMGEGVLRSVPSGDGPDTA